jgi:hypothetical protein
MTRQRVAVAVVVVCVGLIGVGAFRLLTAPSSEALGPAQRVVVVGIPGLNWDRVDSTTMPNLDELAEQSSLGSLTTRGASSFACPRDGWVTIGAGNRATYGDAEGDCNNQYKPTPAIRPESVLEINNEHNFGTEPGLLGREVDCVDTFGTDARLAVIDAPEERAVPTNPTTPEGWSESWSGCPLALVAGPTIYVEDDPEEELRAADELVGQIATAVASEPDTLLLVVGSSDSPGHSPKMHVALAYDSRTNLSNGLLRSASTGRTPYVQLIDVAPTVLDALGQQQPAAMAGRPMVVGEQDVDPRAARSELRDAAAAAAAHRANTPGIVWIWVIVTSAYLVTALILALLRRGRPVLRAGVIIAAIPGATVLANIVPWWKADHLGVSWGLTILGATLAMSIVALAGPWRRLRFGPAIAVAVISVLVLALDVVTGSHLQLNSLLGYNPIVAGRFIGFGNMPFAIYAVCGVITLAAVMHGQTTRTARWLAVLVGGALIIIDGTPGFGADFGGVLALVPAIALLTMIATDIQLSVARILGALAAGVATVTVIAIADYQRPTDDQTHLGRFVGQLFDGTAWEVVERKLDASVYLLLHSPVAIVAPFLAATLIGLFAPKTGPGRQLVATASPSEIGAGVGVATVALLGTLLNDSGIAVFVAAGCVTVPMLLAGTLPPVPTMAEVGKTEAREQV